MSAAPGTVAALLSQHSDALASGLGTLLKAFRGAELGNTIVVLREGQAALGRVRAFYANLRSEVEAASGSSSARRQAVDALDRLDKAFGQAERVLAARDVSAGARQTISSQRAGGGGGARAAGSLMTHWFDRLARASVKDDATVLDRRATLKLAGALALAASPVGRALGASGPSAIPAVTGPSRSCLDECRGRNRHAFHHNLADCTRSRHLFLPCQGVAAFACGWATMYRGSDGAANCKVFVRSWESRRRRRCPWGIRAFPPDRGVAAVRQAPPPARTGKRVATGATCAVAARRSRTAGSAA
jgi:hypothetical protein